MDYRGTIEEDNEVILLLTRVFVEEGYTDRSIAEKMFDPAELRKCGEIVLARSPAGKLLGMVIFVHSTSQARQVAEVSEAEIHLLAVYPEARGQGIASHLIVACEQRAKSFGYSKIVLSTQQTMKKAHHVYEQLGYQPNSVRNWSKGTDKIYFVYEKSLGT